MKITHFLYCPFTGLGLRNGYRGDQWLKNRIKVFNSFTLPSILNQTNRNFVLWVSWRPQERSNPIVQDFYQGLQGIRDLVTVFTYGGLCFWDDKYGDDIASGLLKDHLRATLPELEPYCSDAEYVYMTIQPSDDMYLSDSVDQIQKSLYRWKGAVGWEKGYIMSTATKEIAEYNPNTLPPFATIMFPKDQFLNPAYHYAYTGPYKSHEYVKGTMTFTPLSGRGFVVGTHGENISTTFTHRFKGRTLGQDEAESVMIKTGTLFSKPVIINRPVRLLARHVLNRLPGQAQVRKFYHSLPPKWQLL